MIEHRAGSEGGRGEGGPCPSRHLATTALCWYVSLFNCMSVSSIFYLHSYAFTRLWM